MKQNISESETVLDLKVEINKMYWLQVLDKAYWNEI